MIITVRLVFDEKVLANVERFFEGRIQFSEKGVHIIGSVDNWGTTAMGWAEHIKDYVAPFNRWNIGIIRGLLPFLMSYEDIIIHEVLHSLHLEAGLGDIHGRDKGWKDNAEMFELWKMHYDPNKHFILEHNAMRFILEDWKIITRFGASTPYQKNHRGTDYRARYQPVYAPETGEITKVNSWGYQGGWWLEMRADSGYTLKFAHLSAYRASLGRVEQGQTIAISGNTGAYTTGPHVHFEVWKDGVRIDPEIYFKRMQYVIDKRGNQYILFDLYKVGISISDLEELDKLKRNGLSGVPVPISDDELGGYIIYLGLEIKRLKSLFNL